MTEGGEDDDKGMASDIEGVQNLGGRETLSPIRDEICVCVAVMVDDGLCDIDDGLCGIDGSSGSCGVCDSGESVERIVYRSGGGD